MEFHQTILNNLPYAIAVFDEDGKYIYFNDEELSLRDISEDEMKTQIIFDLFESQDSKMLQDIFKQLFNSDQTEANFCYKRSSRYFSMRLFKIENNHIMSIVMDITEHVENRENIYRLNYAVKGANVGVWDFFPQEGRIVANDTWVTQKKYKTEDLKAEDRIFSDIIGGLKKWASMVHPDDLEQTKELIQRHLTGETEYYEAEFRMMCGDGQYRWIYDLGQVFERDEDNNAVRMNGVHIDLTKIKKLQNELKTKTEELETALQEVKQLSGLLPICSFCKKIRDDKGYWKKIESYIQDHSDAQFTHSVCQECAKKYYPNFYTSEDDVS